MGKAFTGMDSIFESKKTEEKGKVLRPEKDTGETRATFIIEKEILKKIKALAHWERKKIKQVVNDALRTHIEQKGKIKDVPNPS